MTDPFGFHGKTAVVLAASSGMGEAAAKLLVTLGAEVHAVGGKRHKITYEASKTYYADLAEKEQMDTLIARLPEKIDALFLCQGIAATKENALLVQKVNFLSVKYLAEALAPRIADNGSITIISSCGGYGWENRFALCREVIDCKTYEETVEWYETHPAALEGNAYVFSKQCVNAYVKYRVFDPLYMDRKLRLNCICPGYTITGLTEDFNRGASPTGNPQEGAQRLGSLFFSRWNGRPAAAEEMGTALVAIGSQLFSYMSGETIYLDYGLTTARQVDALKRNPAL